ncbi:MAG: efflux RND transporter periplasmic adaptor subunit [Candidatus Ornithospirochaeta sp.]|nr:efflux RND transporter periplasmic adaptor subunit [Candidatus Ornithospirochaeta sp.]
MADDKERKELTPSELQEKRLRDASRARKRKKRIRSLITWIAVLALIACALYYYAVKKAESEAKKKAIENQTVTVETTVRKNTYTQTIDLSGYVVAFDTQSTKFRSTGAVTGVFVEEGDKVTKGQLLASIDSTKQLANLQSIRNSIEQAELSGSTRSLELLRLQEKNAENDLDYTNIYANFDGEVATVNVSVNDYFEAGSSVMTIVDRSKLKATVEIDEIDMQYVELGQKAYLTFDGIPGQVVEARVSYIPMLGRYTNQGIGVVDVELTIDNPPQGLIPGFTFEGTIAVEGDISMLLIPKAAVTTGRGGATTVRKKNADGSIDTVSVRVKYLGEGICQVLAGDIEEGDTLVYDTKSSGSGFAMMMGGAPGGGPRM